LLKLTPVEVLDLTLNGVTDGDGWNFDPDGCWWRIILGLPSMLLCGDRLEFPDDLEENFRFYSIYDNDYTLTISDIYF
jgi:hypothetical protein